MHFDASSWITAVVACGMTRLEWPRCAQIPGSASCEALQPQPALQGAAWGWGCSPQDALLTLQGGARWAAVLCCAVAVQPLLV